MSKTGGAAAAPSSRWPLRSCSPAFRQPAGAAEQPKRGGTLVFGINSGDPPTYDCHQSTLFPIIHLLSPHYSNLLRIDIPNYPKIVGDLAESWTRRRRRQDLHFRLRAGVKFHDGSPFSAEDVKATYDRLRNPPQGVVSVRQGLVADIDTIDTPDPLSVIFRLKRPNRALIYAFANPFNCVYSAAKLKENPLVPGAQRDGHRAVQLRRARGAARIGRASASRTTSRPDLPYLDGFHAIFTQGAALINALQGSQIMADFRSVTQVDRDRLVGALGNKITVQESPWLNALLITFNTNKKPFDDAARAPRAVARGRPLEGGRGAAALHHHALRRRLSCGRATSWPRARRTWSRCRASPATSRPRAPRRGGCSRRPASPNLKIRLTNRTIANLFTGGGVYVIDQWRQIGVETEHIQANDVLYNNALNEGTFDVALVVPGRLGRRADLPAHPLPVGRSVLQPGQVHRPRARPAVRAAEGRDRPRGALQVCCASSRCAC